MRTFPKMPVRLARCSRAALWCALSLCAMPLNAHAQQSPSVPVLRDIPLMSRLFTTPPVAKAPVLGDLPIIGRLYRVEPKTPAQPKVMGRQEAVSPPVPAQASGSTQALVSIEAKSATLGQVIELLMDQAHLSYTLDPNLEKLSIGSLKLRKVPFEIALRTLLKSAAGRATYTVEDGIYRILPQENLDAERQNTGVNPPVTPVAPTGPGGFGPFGSPGGFSSPAAPARKAAVEVLPSSQAGAEARVNLDMENTDLYDALKLIFTKAKLNYMLDPSLRSLSITAHIKGLAIHSALELLLKSVDSPVPLTYSVENGVYKIVDTLASGKP